MARRRWVAQQMRELLHEHERSGMSLKAFAAAAEIPHSTLSWWRTRLRADAKSTRFVPVHVEELRRPPVEIVVGDVVVRVADADENAVADGDALIFHLPRRGARRPGLLRVGDRGNSAARRAW